MKKLPPVLLLLSILLFTSGFSVKEWRASLYDSIKTEAQKSFSALLGRPVVIESAGGIVVGQIELRGVTFTGFGHAARVVLNFNPLKYAIAKGDIIPALTKITISDGDFDVVRDRLGRWEVLSLLPREEPGAPAVPAFAGRLVIKNCRVNYLDHRGWRTTPQRFEVNATAVNGSADLRKKDRVQFSVSGKVPELVKAQGFFDQKTGYDLEVSAANLEFKKWANYTVPLPGFEALGGKADIFLQVAPPKTKGWTASLTGKVFFNNAAGRFQSYELKRVNGKLFIADENLGLTDLKAEINGLPLIVNGRFYDFTKQNLDLSVLIKDADLRSLTGFFPRLKDLDIAAKGSAELKFSGSASQPRVEGTFDVSEGKVYGQKFSGAGSVLFADSSLSIEAQKLALYQGISSIKLSLNFPKVGPELKLTARFSKISLGALMQEAPGIEGRAEGTIELAGPIGDLSGKISATLSRALVLGQPIENVSSSFKIKGGEFYLEKLLASSGNVTFFAGGKISRDLTLRLQAEATGLRLSGKGIFGSMEATLSKFRGEMSLKIDPEFFASPLKYLSASGEATLINGHVGEQTFDQAGGKIAIGGGRIQIEETLLQSGKSLVRASGQTGIGCPTDLKISGQMVNLEDLKILNYLLPAEAKNPKGLTSFEVEVTGFLSRETKIASLDPLLDLTAKGNLSILNCSFAEIPINAARLNFAWQDRSLFLSDCRLNFPHSALTLDFVYKRDGTIDGTLKGVADLSYFKALTAKYGKIGGQAGLSLQAKGPAGEPSISASLWLDRFFLNELSFDHASGSFNFYRGRLTLLEPALFRNGTDLYSLSGNAKFDPEKPDESTLDLNFKVLQADLASAYRLFGRLQGEFIRRFPAPAGASGKEPSLKINLSDLAISNHQPSLRNKILRFQVIRQEFEKQFAAAPEENMSGSLSGEFQLNGKINDLSGKLSGRVSKGSFRNYQFDDFVASASLKGQELKFEKAILSKDKGSISARGDYNFNGNVSLNVSADNMPLDILQIIFPGKEFKGNFSMNAGFDGPVQNLRLSLAASGKDVRIAGIDFDEASLSVTKSNDSLYLHELALLQGGILSKADGSIVLSHPGKINLEANLGGNAIGLLNLFTEEIRWKKGSSQVSAEITGTLENPDINGKIEITEGTLYVRSLASDLQDLRGKASVENNLLRIESLTGTWMGERTRYLPDPVGLAGNIDLSKMLAQKNMVDLNLVFSPTRLYLSFPNLYTGVLDLKELSLEGPLYFDFSQGPLLKGIVEANDAVITLSQPGARQGKVFPLNFDLEANLTKNVYATMGNIATLDLSNILMNLEIGGGLKISGNLEAPGLLGKIAIKRGTVNIFNREFTLLSPETQKKYFPYDSEKIQDNVAVFSGEEGPAGIMPDINIISSTNVENLEKDASGKYVKKLVDVLARLKGTIGAKEEERGLKIYLFAYTEDRTKTPVEMVPAAYSEQDLKVMLLPDFIKSLAGIGRPEELQQEKVDTNAVVADYLSSRVQTLLFRGIEREVEQKLGLESLTLEYNLGPKFREALGVKDAPGFETEKPAWSVGFVKGFTDRLFIDVRYAQGMEQAAGSAAQTTFNYQLTYKLSLIWSIIYYREPISLSEITTGYQKIMLKAGFSLW